MLKTGTKGLYVFDRNGQHYQVSPQCVLDFYIHESRQRTGLGRRLFEHMLQVSELRHSKWTPREPFTIVPAAANRAGKNGDRPAEWQVSRLSEQALRPARAREADEQLCGVRRVLSQDARDSGPCGRGQKVGFEAQIRALLLLTLIPSSDSHPVSQKQSANGLQQGSHLPSQTYGRYGAAHRPCSMGQVY